MRTTLHSILLIGLLALELSAQPSASAPRLAGIVNLPDLKLAVLEVAGAGRPHLILAVGQRDGDIAVREFNPDEATVKLVWSGTNGDVSVSLTRQNSRAGALGFGIELENADTDPVLRLYQEFTQRTLLRSPRLVASPFNLRASATNRAQAALVLEEALTEKEITTIPDGDKFIMVVPNSQVASVRPHSAEIKSSGTNAAGSEMLSPGTVDFRSADLRQVEQIYAEMIGRKLDRTEPLPFGAPIYFKTQTPLTKEECIYALDTLLSWRNVKMLLVGDDTVKAVWISAK